MADRDRGGFTLVELLVVILIIGVLAGLLLPAVLSARARARQAQCTNNQHEIALAIQQYETAKHHLSGYIDNFGSNVRNLSWITVLLPHLDREDLWRAWRDPNVTMSQKYTQARGELAQLICPSDRPDEDAALSYVANSGIVDIPDPNSTVADDRRPDDGATASGLYYNGMAPGPPTVMTDGIPDGSQTTLLISENVHATAWAPLLDSNTGTWTGLTLQQKDWREAHVAMVWWTDDRIRNHYLPQGGDNAWANAECYRINKCRDEQPVPPEILFARPSSMHVGGVVVTYADGHQDFLGDDVDYEVFARQMAPNDDAMGIPASLPNPPF